MWYLVLFHTKRSLWNIPKRMNDNFLFFKIDYFLWCLVVFPCRTLFPSTYPASSTPSSPVWVHCFCWNDAKLKPRCIDNSSDGAWVFRGHGLLRYRRQRRQQRSNRQCLILNRLTRRNPVFSAHVAVLENPQPMTGKDGGDSLINELWS